MPRLVITDDAPGSVSDLHFAGLDPQAEFIPIDEQSEDNVMHLDRLEKQIVLCTKRLIRVSSPYNIS